MTDQSAHEIGPLLPSLEVDAASLVNAPAPSGFEDAHQQRWKGAVGDAADELVEDTHGNVLAVAGDTNADDAIAFAAHADQIGLMVRSIDDDGFLRPGAIGEVDRTVLPGQRVEVLTDVESEGPPTPITGVISQPTRHIRDEEAPTPSAVEDQRIDIRATGPDDAREEVSIGDPIVFGVETDRMRNGRIVGPGLDNRAGTVTVAEAFYRLAREELDRPVVAISTVQEETGQTGAKFAGRSLGDELELSSVWELVSELYVLDVTFATDHLRTPGGFTSEVALGDGPVVTRGGINDQQAVERARTAGKEALGSEDAVQVEAITGRPGTDTEAFLEHSGGVSTCYIGIPNRYMHTTSEMVDAGDLADTVELLMALAAGE